MAGLSFDLSPSAIAIKLIRPVPQSRVNTRSLACNRLNVIIAIAANSHYLPHLHYGFSQLLRRVVALFLPLSFA